MFDNNTMKITHLRNVTIIMGIDGVMAFAQHLRIPADGETLIF
jgi:hypothetical protein